MLFMICRTPVDPCSRSKLDEFKAVDDCCGCVGFIDVTLLLLLSKIVGIAVPLPPPENRFNSLAADVEPFCDELRRFRNDNDFKRLNLVDSRWALFDAPGDDCWWRSSNDDTNWSKTFKSAFILEFRMAVADVVPSALLDDGKPCRRWVIYRIRYMHRTAYEKRRRRRWRSINRWTTWT